MDIGVDTFRSRLDLIVWNSFRTWNGGGLVNGTLVGGEPAFAGRHFLGGPEGEFIWGHGEATDCKTNPNPEHLQQLNLLTNAIAPIQAPMTTRQQKTGAFGLLYGKIDADAICNRIAASLIASEFVLPAGGLVYVWLTVDPTVTFSADYWAGWSDTVNHFAFFFVPADGPRVAQPFRAAILCAFSPTGGKLRPDPHVPATLAASRVAYKGSNTKCFACWADAPTTAAPDWTVFDGGPRPVVWRISHNFSIGGNVVNDLYDVDACNPGGDVPNVIDFMLVVEHWQPNVPNIQQFGFITDQGKGITAAQIPRIQANAIPSFTDLGGHYTLSGGSVQVIGRYLKPTIVKPGFPAGSFAMTRTEAVELSRARFQLFTIWEDINVLAAGQPLNIGYFDAAHHAGTEDGQNAFTYCGDTLQQPPHTPVFFTVDFDAADPPADAAAARTKITDYLTLVKNARDAYTLKNPDRPYLIGIYGNGEVNRWAYEQGLVTFFWQSTGPGSTGNTMPHEFPFSPPQPFRPWYHANRWQFSKDARLSAAGWTIVPGADPDVDWADGGTWNLFSPLARALEHEELKNSLLGQFFPFLVDLDL
jgi:hypothetical protein